MDALKLKRNVSIQSKQQWLSTLWFKTCFEIVYKHNEDTSLKRLLSNHHCRACSSSFRGFYYFFWGWILYLNESPVVIHWSARKLLFTDKCLLCHNTQISHSRRLETLRVRFDVNDVKCFGFLVSWYVRLKCVFCKWFQDLDKGEARDLTVLQSRTENVQFCCTHTHNHDCWHTYYSKHDCIGCFVVMHIFNISIYSLMEVFKMMLSQQ